MTTSSPMTPPPSEAGRWLAPDKAENGSAGAVTLRSAEFRKGREANWKQLEEMIGRVEQKGLTALSARDSVRLPLLYRSAMSSLSVARYIVLDRNLLLYLEDLSLRAYLVVYGPRTGLWVNLKDFILRGFPRAVRGIAPHLAATVMIMLCGIAAGYLLVKGDASYFHTLVPDELAGGRGPASSPGELKETLFPPWPGWVDTFVVFANALFTHNTMVGILAFGLCFALGLPTVFLIAYNGMILGAFIAVFADKGLALDFIGWVSIHGVTELLAIALCGAAGLSVAEKIIFPGRLPRLESLALSGRRAASVVAGCILLFFIAGILEGGFRQWVNFTTGRYVFALVTGIFWLYYFALAGKDAPEDAPEN